MIHADIVEEIIIKIFHSSLSQLFIKNLIPVLSGLDISCVQLIRQGIAVSGVTVHQRFFGRALALKSTVHPGCIKISKSVLNKGVYHILYLFHVDAGRFVRISKRQAHQAKS